MARIKYYYDTETCKYERIRVSTWDIVLNLMGFFFLAVIVAVGIVGVFFYFHESPKEAMQRRENQSLRIKYELINEEVDSLSMWLGALQERDDNIYRVIMEADPLPTSVRRAGTGGSNRYKRMLNNEEVYDPDGLIENSFDRIAQLKRQMYVQSTSYDELLSMANNKAKMLASIPAIQPVSNKELKRLASGYGYRMHPIYKIRKMHWGIDFSAPRGTPIYATGDGKIKKAKRSNRAVGYGNYVVIDHGYGYETLYGHMLDMVVREGQTVKRGELIGYVGNTGGSTAPHCHYEVMKDGKKVNPIKYFFQDINDDEYDKLLELSAVENQSLG